MAGKERARLMKDQVKVSQCFLLLSSVMWVQTLWCSAGLLMKSWVCDSMVVFVQQKTASFFNFEE